MTQWQHANGNEVNHVLHVIPIMHSPHLGNYIFKGDFSPLAQCWSWLASEAKATLLFISQYESGAVAKFIIIIQYNVGLTGYPTMCAGEHAALLRDSPTKNTTFFVRVSALLNSRKVYTIDALALNFFQTITVSVR